MVTSRHLYGARFLLVTFLFQISHADQITPYNRYTDFRKQVTQHLVDNLKNPSTDLELTQACKNYHQAAFNSIRSLISPYAKVMWGLGSFVFYSRATNLFSLGNLDKNLGTAALATAASVSFLDIYSKAKNRKELTEKYFNEPFAFNTQFVTSVTEHISKTQDYKNLKRKVGFGIGSLYAYKNGLFDTLYNFNLPFSLKPKTLLATTLGLLGIGSFSYFYNKKNKNLEPKTDGPSVSFADPVDTQIPQKDDLVENNSNNPNCGQSALDVFLPEASKLDASDDVVSPCPSPVLAAPDSNSISPVSPTSSIAEDNHVVMIPVAQGQTMSVIEGNDTMPVDINPFSNQQEVQNSVKTPEFSPLVTPKGSKPATPEPTPAFQTLEPAASSADAFDAQLSDPITQLNNQALDTQSDQQEQTTDTKRLVFI